MHILGLCNGSIDGNSEVLLNTALAAAVAVNSSLTTSWIHVPSVAIPRNPGALPGSIDVSVGTNAQITAKGQASNESDDRRFVLDAILDADALILTSPVYSHQPAGFLKAVFDRIGGPYTDQVFAMNVLKAQKKGDPRFQSMKVDERLLKPRVVAFLCVAGSTVPDQVTMALPTMHTLVYPMQAKVVDQDILLGYSQPGSVLVLNGGAAITRAETLGRNVASQIGKSYDDAQYLGPEPAGACPYCHLAKFELLEGLKNEVGCLTCGAKGVLKIDQEGVILPVWEKDSAISSLTVAGKLAHIDDIADISVKVAQEMSTITDFDDQRKQWKAARAPALTLPSQK